jgi:hypothetical protein
VAQMMPVLFNGIANIFQHIDDSYIWLFAKTFSLYLSYAPCPNHLLPTKKTKVPAEPGPLSQLFITDDS